MNLLQETRRILRQYGYSVGPSPAASDQIHFEDESLMGFVWEAPSAESLLKNWETKQDEFLRKNAPMLRSSGFKSWNIYAVFLTGATSSPTECTALKQIEEDFRATRKIARADVETTSQLSSALYPFIPIQHIVPFETEDSNQRVRERLKDLPQQAIEALFDQKAELKETFVRFVSSYETQPD